MNIPYAIFSLIISVFSILILAGDVFFVTNPNEIAVIKRIDMVICFLFFLDFLYQLTIAESKSKYFFTWGWVDLLSSIPMIDAFRAGRLLRIYRLIRIIRVIKVTKLLVQFFAQHRLNNVALVASLLALITISLSSMAILMFETGEGSNIKTAEDALWWSYVTITTVGYGDRFPVTTEGRILGAILMTIGVGLFGIFSGFIASWCLKPTEDKQDIELRDVHDEVQKLKLKIEQLIIKLEDETDVRL